MASEQLHEAKYLLNEALSEYAENPDCILNETSIESIREILRMQEELEEIIESVERLQKSKEVAK